MHAKIGQLVDAVGKVLTGKEHEIRLSLCCLLARGHLLIEDLPGMGKTTLSHALSVALGLEFQRVQFTSDLLPSDILGVSIFNRDSGNFEFQPGPVFSQVLLADEVNRATPKTQSALLEAMAEGQVTIDGDRRDLPTPFFVIATQNPERHGGTFPLPESQLDRFTMRLSLGYPGPEAERDILLGKAGGDQLANLRPQLQAEELASIQQHIEQVRLSEAVLSYIQRILGASRQSAELSAGLSPRAALSLVACSRAWACMEGRDYVVPEDVQAVFIPVSCHRLRDHANMASASGALSHSLLSEVEVIS